MFEITYKLTDEDYLKFNEHHMLNSVVGRKNLNAHRMIGPAISLFCIVILFIVAGAQSIVFWFDFALFAILSVLWVVFSKKTMMINIKHSIKNMKKDGKLPYSSSGKLIFDEEGIREITENSEKMTKYSSVEKMYVEDSAIYIYFSSAQAYIVPYACLGDEAKKEELVEFLRGKIGV